MINLLLDTLGQRLRKRFDPCRGKLIAVIDGDDRPGWVEVSGAGIEPMEMSEAEFNDRFKDCDVTVIRFTDQGAPTPPG